MIVGQLAPDRAVQLIDVDIDLQPPDTVDWDLDDEQ